MSEDERGPEGPGFEQQEENEREHLDMLFRQHAVDLRNLQQLRREIEHG